jgi:membrane protease YdiL (CAAX protease family)
LYGCAGGFASLSLLVAVLYGGGFLVFDGVALHGLSIVFWGVLWLAAFVLVGLSEETMFRGYIQYTLARGIGFWPGAVLISLLFGAAHLQNHGENFFGIVQVVAAGLIFCLLLWLSGSLWLAIGFHTAWDWAQSFFYGTPDSGLMMAQHLFITHAAGNPRFSGGSAGPEGSLLAAPILLLGLLVLVLVCRRLALFEVGQLPARLEGGIEGRPTLAA